MTQDALMPSNVREIDHIGIRCPTWKQLPGS